MKIYPFKRDFYNEVVSGIENAKVSFLLGPRKCGKTVCLKQAEANIPNAEYINLKSTEEDSRDVFARIYNSIKNDEKKIYLIDEITYADHPDTSIYALSDVLSEYPSENTRIVLTGSQSLALEQWGRAGFAGMARFIRADFLSYQEWLRYKSLTEVSEDTFERFLYEVDDFYGFESLRDYLEGCLTETIYSNAKAQNIIIGNECSRIDVTMLVGICYATLFSLHNHVRMEQFASQKKLEDDISYYFRDVCRELGDEIGDRIADAFSEKYGDIMHSDSVGIAQSLRFLQNCGLISVVPVTDDIEQVSELRHQLKRLAEDRTSDFEPGNIFRDYNIICRYPLFYMAVVREILKDKMPEHLSDTYTRCLMGAITECYVRGLLPEGDIFEYHDEDGHEIDHVDRSRKYAVEITVGDKTMDAVHLDCLPSDFKKYLLTKERCDTVRNIRRIPYYVFLFNGCNFEKTEQYIEQQIPQSVLIGRMGKPFADSKKEDASVWRTETDIERIKNMLNFPHANLDKGNGLAIIQNLSVNPHLTPDLIAMIAAGDIEGQGEYLMTNKDVAGNWKNIILNESCPTELLLDIAKEVMINREAIGTESSNDFLREVSLVIRNRQLKEIAGLIYGFSENKTTLGQACLMLSIQERKQNMNSLFHVPVEKNKGEENCKENKSIANDAGISLNITHK